MSEDGGLSRFEEKWVEKQSELHRGDLDFKPAFLNGVFLFLMYWFQGLTGLGAAVYLVIGISLARRVGQEGGKVEWLVVSVFWPVLLVLDSVNGGGESA